MPTFCQNFQAHALNRDTKQFVRLRCKQWSCEFCAGLNRYIWRKHIASVVRVRGYENWSLVTVTARAKAHKHGTTLETIIKSWDKLIKRLKRAWGNFEYLRVYEKHESGQFHAHMLINYKPDDATDAKKYQAVGKGRRYRGQAHKELKRACWGSGLGYICDFSPIDTDGLEGEHAINRVAYYVTKYLTKNLANVPKGTRRIQPSLGIGKPRGIDGAGGKWEAKLFLYEHDIDELGVIEDVSRKHLVSYDDFDSIEVYPNPTLDDY